ncbi:MAG: ABC transporter substrate-binding protein [Spirochaetaceae bacterium]|jgi:branched-chain amino acid transport system substrate-binding protein|nr:ABC transporter substrate-binding protein [Spirochaetaceae bacterium]
MKRILLVFSTIIMLLSLTGAQPAAEIVIGINLPLTDNTGLSPVGRETKNAAEMILARIKVQGGLEIRGRRYPLRFVYVDNEMNVERAPVAARRLVEGEKVLAVIGPLGSRRAIPAGEFCNANKTPMISPWSTDPATTKGRPYVFRACFVDPFQAPAAARFTREKFNAVKTAILYSPEDNYSKTLAELYRDSWNTNYGEVAAWESCGQSDSDFSAQLSRIISSGAEVLYLPVYYDIAARIVPQAKSLGWDKPVMGADAWGSADLWNLSEGSVAGYYFTTHYTAAGAVGKTREFIDAYRAIYGYVPGDVAALTRDAIDIVLQGIQNAGLTGNLARDRNALRNALAETAGFEGVTGKISRFDREGDPVKEVLVIKINSGGQFVYETAVQPGR